MYEALLFRLNPKIWPTWREDILSDSQPFPLIHIGRRIREELGPGIPVVALGTDGLGFVAIGKTISEVQDCEDLDFEGVDPEYVEIFLQVLPRISARFKLSNPRTDFRENQLISSLIYRRDTLNPISYEEYLEFEKICR